jgi:hypothetical protein
MESITTKDNAIKVKLLRFWMRDNYSSDLNIHFMSHGIWQTIGVDITERGRVYELQCAWPMHSGLKVGEKIRIPEELIIKLCLEVEIKHLPKIEDNE